MSVNYENIANDAPMTVIGGMNVLEARDLAFRTCEAFLEATSKHGIPYIFKASFDKANRTSIESYRGPGLDAGLDLLREIQEKFEVSVLTDVHEPWQASRVAEVADYLQLPAFLARQTDLVAAIAATEKPVNIKKPQFISPGQVGHIAAKFRAGGNDKLLICERGSQFGYDNLVVDVLGFSEMKEATGGVPLIFDITHSLQKRSSGDSASGGRRAQFLELGRAGVSVGIAGVFIEAHPNPDQALCDGPSAIPTDLLRHVIGQLRAVDDLVKAFDPIQID